MNVWGGIELIGLTCTINKVYFNFGLATVVIQLFQNVLIFIGALFVFVNNCNTTYDEIP